MNASQRQYTARKFLEHYAKHHGVDKRIVFSSWAAQNEIYGAERVKLWGIVRGR